MMPSALHPVKSIVTDASCYVCIISPLLVSAAHSMLPLLDVKSVPDLLVPKNVSPTAPVRIRVRRMLLRMRSR